MFKEYVWQRQSYLDLSKKYGKSIKTIQTELDKVFVKSKVRINKKKIIVIADVTFFSRRDAICVFREPNIKKNIWWKFIQYEKGEVYKLGKEHLEKNGFVIEGVVLDGKPGVRQLFGDIPVQMCHFHQIQIIQRYLTKNPKLEASIELKRIVLRLSYTKENIFIQDIAEWYLKWESFLKEKTINPETGKWSFTHKRLRSAYRSLKLNIPYLFTFSKYPDLNIPNTTNSLDGYFNVLKTKLNIHRGLSKERRNKVIIELLKGQF